MNLKKLFLALLISIFSSLAFSQGGPIRGEESAGVYSNLKSTSGVLQTIINSGTVSVNVNDPCQGASVKVTAPINITTAATTAIVVPVGGQTVYVCSFALTISQVITTANTLQFIQGTGAACVTGPTALTGLFGGGGVTASAPIVISSGGGMVFKTNASSGLCATTAIGASASFQGFVTYVQQ